MTSLFLGIIFSKDDYWTENRCTSHRLLKEFGFGKQSTLESLLLEELKEFVEEIKFSAINGNATVEVTNQFDGIFLNVMWSMLTGERFPHGHPHLLKLHQLTLDFTSSQQLGGGAAGLFPSLIDYLPGWTGFTKYQESCVAFRTFLKVRRFVIKIYLELDLTQTPKFLVSVSSFNTKRICLQCPCRCRPAMSDIPDTRKTMSLSKCHAQFYLE